MSATDRGAGPRADSPRTAAAGLDTADATADAVDNAATADAADSGVVDATVAGRKGVPTAAVADNAAAAAAAATTVVGSRPPIAPTVPGGSRPAAVSSLGSLGVVASSSAAGQVGLASVLGEDFSFAAAIGGVRGAIESILPGLGFVVVFVVSRSLLLSIVISAVIALGCLVARLVSHGQVRSALTGAVSLLICLVWAWSSRSAKNFYAPGFFIDAAWALVLLVSVGVRIPGIGAVVELFRSPLSGGFTAWLRWWRADRRLVRAYTVVTWLWVATFLARLLVQVPLYLANLVGLLGTARLVMGIPLVALVLWLSWLLISPQLHRVDQERAGGPPADGQASDRPESDPAPAAKDLAKPAAASGQSSVGD